MAEPRDDEIRLELSSEAFDLCVQRAAAWGVTPAEYVSRALAAYALEHHPDLKVRLHPCVAVPCPQCLSVAGEPCKGGVQARYIADTHYARRNAYRAAKRLAKSR